MVEQQIQISYKGYVFPIGQLEYKFLYALKQSIGAIGQEHLQRAGRYVLDEAIIYTGSEQMAITPSPRIVIVWVINQTELTGWYELRIEY